MVTLLILIFFKKLKFGHVFIMTLFLIDICSLGLSPKNIFILYVSFGSHFISFLCKRFVQNGHNFVFMTNVKFTNPRLLRF